MYIFNLFLREDLPSDWRMTYISNSYKKGDQENCSNYQALSVNNSIASVYGKVIKQDTKRKY
jgi:hypothetical protein